MTNLLVTLQAGTGMLKTKTGGLVDTRKDAYAAAYVLDSITRKNAISYITDRIKECSAPTILYDNPYKSIFLNFLFEKIMDPSFGEILDINPDMSTRLRMDPTYTEIFKETLFAKFLKAGENIQYELIIEFLQMKKRTGISLDIVETGILKNYEKENAQESSIICLPDLRVIDEPILK